MSSSSIGLNVALELIAVNAIAVVTAAAAIRASDSLAMSSNSKSTFRCSNSALRVAS